MISRQRIRLGVETSNTDPLMNVLTGLTPRIWRGVAVQFEIAALLKGVPVDMDNITSLTVEVKVAARTGDAVMTKTLDAADLTTVLSQADWGTQAAEHCHALVEFSGTETAPSLGGLIEAEFWVVVSVITSEGEPVTLGGAVLVIVEDGSGTGTSPTPAVSYYTSAQSDARYMLLTGTNFRIGPTGEPQVRDRADANRWVTIFAENGASGQE